MAREYLLLLGVTTALLAGALGCYTLLWVRERRWLGSLGTLAMRGGALGALTLLGWRWLAAGRPPCKSLHECMVLLMACLVVQYLVIERGHGLRLLGGPTALGCVVAGFGALHWFDPEIEQLPAALQSGWFIPHVLAYFLAYATLFLGGALGCLALRHPDPIGFRRPYLFGPRGVDLLVWMDRTVRLGFVLLTLGLFLGAIWAQAAWGHYWGWDPKENWALASWLVFALYLHVRHLEYWRGRRQAALVVAGVGVIVFTYLGMNLLPTAAQSVHLYQ